MIRLNLSHMKICVKCGINQAKGATPSRPSGFSYCQPCFNIEQAKYRSKHPEKIREINQDQYWKNHEKRLKNAEAYRRDHQDKIKESTHSSRARKREIIDRAKDVPCRDCNLRFPPECMDFDHVVGEKLFNIAKIGGSSMSDRILYEEMAKCEIVCSNCHRIRTKKRRISISSTSTLT